MDILYIIIKNTYFLGGEERENYGIAVVDKNDEHTILDSVPDISFDIHRVEILTMLCNGFQIPHLHFRNVIDDFLNDNGL